MDKVEKGNIPVKAARIISVLFHPLFMPVFGLAIIMSALTPFGYLPFNVKRLIFLIIVINNVFLPLALLPFLMQMNLISSWNLIEKKERYIPLVITTLLYATTSYIFFRFPIPFFIKSYIFSTFLVSLLITVVNFSSRISLHSAGAGALLATFLILLMRMYISSDRLFISAIITGGLILSSRLMLNLHNPRQVWLGFFTGFTGFMAFMLFFKHLGESII